MLTEEIGMQSLEDKTNWEYDDAYNGEVRTHYNGCIVFEEELEKLKKYGIPNNWIELAQFVEKDLNEANKERENDSRIEFHYNEDILKDFGYLFFNNLSVYLYRDGYNEDIVSNYMFFNKWFDKENSSLMIDLYCRRDDYLDFDIAGRILQEMANVWRDIPLYLEEKRQKENNIIIGSHTVTNEEKKEMAEEQNKLNKLTEEDNG